jgi:hypothetical protein
LGDDLVAMMSFSYCSYDITSNHKTLVRLRPSGVVGYSGDLAACFRAYFSPHENNKRIGEYLGATVYALKQ